MPKLQQNLAMAYGSVAADLQKRLGDAQAAQAGPPVSEKIEPMTAEKQVAAWNAREPKATDEAMMAMAMERFQAHLRSGMDPEKAQRATAEDLTHFRYAKRLGLYTYGQIGFAEQVKEAAHLARLARSKRTPDPLPPPPTMPSAAATNVVTIHPELLVTEPPPQAMPAVEAPTEPPPPPQGGPYLGY